MDSASQTLTNHSIYWIFILGNTSWVPLIYLRTSLLSVEEVVRPVRNKAVTGTIKEVTPKIT